MPSISYFKAQYPQFANVDDNELLDITTKMGLDVYPDGAGATVEPESRPFMRDAGLSLAQGMLDIPQAAIGLADIPTGGNVGKSVDAFLNNNGFDTFAQKQAQLDALLSPQQQAANNAVQQADGVGGTVGALIDHPSTILMSALRSTPSMAAGGGVGKATGLASSLARGAVGEGAVSAGLQAEQIRQQTPDQLLTPGQSLAAGVTGLSTGGINALSGGLANKYGLGDLDQYIAGGNRGTGSFAARTVGGATSEGGEEAAQSTNEQMLSNAALDKPLTEGVGNSAVVGAATGGFMGGMFGMLPKGSQPTTASPADLLSQARQTQQTQQPVGDALDQQLHTSNNFDIESYRAVRDARRNTTQPPASTPIDTKDPYGFDVTKDGILGALSFSNKPLEGELLAPDNTLGVDLPKLNGYLDGSLSQGVLDNQRKLPKPNENNYGNQETTTNETSQNSGQVEKRLLGVDKPNINVDPVANLGAVQPLASSDNTEPSDPYASVFGSELKAVRVAKKLADPHAVVKNTDGKFVIIPSDETLQGSESDYVRRAIIRSGIRPKSPGYDAQVSKIKADYTDKIDQHVSSLPFEHYNRVDTSPAARSAYSANSLDSAAQQAATSPDNDLPEPTQAQKEAGNYKKGHVQLHGLDITIENPRGSERSGVDKSGKPWTSTISHHYGYIKRTKGADGDQVDVFIGPNPESEKAFVVNQVDPETGKFDEHKIMLGFDDKTAANQGYHANYQKGWKGAESITEITIPELKDKINSGVLDKPIKKPSTNKHTIVSIRDIDGKRHNVYEHDLNGKVFMIGRTDAKGSRIASIHRENILKDQSAPTPYFANKQFIGINGTEQYPNGRAFVTEAAAKKKQTEHFLHDTHEIIKNPKANGFILKKRDVTTSTQPEPIKEPNQQTENVQRDDVAASNQPWLNNDITDEHRWLGSRVEYIPSLKREHAYTGTVKRVIKGSSSPIIEVNPDGTDSDFRLRPEQIKIISIKDNSIAASDRTSIEEVTGEVKKPKIINFVATNHASTVAGQKELSDHTSRIAALTALNNAVRKRNPDAAYKDSEIQRAANINEIQNWLINNQTQRNIHKSAIINARYSGKPALEEVLTDYPAAEQEKPNKQPEPTKEPDYVDTFTPKTNSEKRSWLVAKINNALLEAPDVSDNEIDNHLNKIAVIRAEGVLLSKGINRTNKRAFDSAFNREISNIRNFGLKDILTRDYGYITFKIPNGGTYKILNIKSRLETFKKKVLSNPGFNDRKGGSITAIKSAPQNSTQSTINNFLADGELANAYYASVESNTQFVIGSTPSDKPVLFYTDIEPIKVKGYVGDRELVIGKRYADGKPRYQVLYPNKGVALGGSAPTKNQASLLAAEYVKGEDLTPAFNKLDDANPDLNQESLLARFKQENGIDDSDEDTDPTPPIGTGSNKTNSEYGSKNTVFTSDAADKARALLKAKLGTLNSGLDPDVMQAGLTLAGYHIEAGARKYADYARAMVGDLGEAIRPYLRSFYESVRYYPGFDNAGMTPASEIENVPSPDNNLEPDSTDTTTENQGNEGSVPDGRKTDGSSVNTPSGNNAQEGVKPNSDSGGTVDPTAIDRKRSDKPLYPTESTTLPSELPTGADQRGRGGNVGNIGIQSNATPSGVIAYISERGNAKADTATPVKGSIAETVPALNSGQQADVAFAEARLSEHPGVMLTNGTGTGKTFSGLGIIKRMALNGKDNTIIVVPSDPIANQWVKAGSSFFDMAIKRLRDTKDNGGKGIVITTFANFGDNETLALRNWDACLIDEAHRLMMNQEGEPTAALNRLRALTKHRLGFYNWFRSVYKTENDALSKSRLEYDNVRSDANKLAFEKARAVYSEAEKKARVEWDTRPTTIKTVMLSATPFAYVKNIDLAEGYLFHYDTNRDGSGYNSTNGKEAFFVQHFGYRMRYNKLTQPDANVDTGLMERQFNATLRKSGALSYRALDVDFDYDRKFILTESTFGSRIDAALDWVRDQRFNELGEALRKKFNYQARQYLLESLKANEVVPIIREHLRLGRKVLVFHDFKKGGVSNPFVLGNPNNVKGLSEQIEAFNDKFGDLIGSFDALPSPIDALSKAFPNLIVFNGDSKNKTQLQNRFNDDNSKHDVILVQAGSAKEGVSFHDTTGKHQRVLINIGLPTAPTTAIQQEGRIYRVGQMSNALFRYMNTGTNWERWAFATTIASRAGTAENLAAGEGARGLKDAFINAFEQSDYYPAGHDGEGIGGKEADKVAISVLTEYDRAKSFYFGQQKKTSRTKAQEGVDYFATPEPVGLVMTWLADARQGESMLEPSGGHGAIARWFRDDARKTAIEPSGELSSRLALVFDGDIKRERFEDLNLVNKYDAIVMNPPFGVGGKTAAEHVSKAINHLRDGGRIVALIPSGPSMDKRFESLMTGKTDVRQVYDIKLPSVTFERAGAAVNAHIVVLEKTLDPLDLIDLDYSNAKNINELFDRLENIQVTERVKNTEEEVSPVRVLPVIPGQSESDKYVTSAPEIEYETKRGKLLKGVIAKDLTEDQAKKFDKYTWRKDGGYFIRMEHVQRPTLNPEEVKYSKSNKRITGMEKAHVQAIVNKFSAGLGSRLDVQFKVYNNPREAFGDKFDDATGTTKGFYTYQNGQNIVGVFADSLGGVQDTLETLRHETLAHFGLNLFTPKEKKIFLDSVRAAKNDPKVKALFDEVAKDYDGLNLHEYKQAEEVFARIAEPGNDGKFARVWSRLLYLVMPMLRRVGVFTKPPSKAELRGAVYAIAQSIRDGKQQQTFPSTPDAQFSRLSSVADTILASDDVAVRSMDDFNHVLESGRMPEQRRTWVDTADKIVELFTDATRPFDVWARSLPDQIAASNLVGAKDRAVERKKAFEKQVMLKFGDNIGLAVRKLMESANWKDYRAAKEMAGHWMTARYAPIANANLLRQYRDLEQEAFDALDEFNNNPDTLLSPSEIADERERLAKKYSQAAKKAAQFESAMNNPDIVDPNITTHKIGLAGGYNNATAKALMSQIEAIFDRSLLEDAAKHVYAMNAWKLEQDIINGKVPQEIADKFDDSGLYVPLTGDPRNDDSSEDFFSTGNVNQQKDRRLRGRTSGFAQNGIDASFEQVEKSSRYHGWVDFKDTLTSIYNKLVADYVEQGLSEIEARKAIADDYDITRHVEMPGQRVSDDGIIVRKNGEAWVYELNNKAAIDALRSLNNEDTPSVLKPLGFLNMWNARFVTQFMPFFAIKNAMMDTVERSENIRSRTIPGYGNVDMNRVGGRTLSIATSSPVKLLHTIASVVSQNTPLAGWFPIDYTNPETASVMEFLNEGGASTWGDYLNTDSKGLSNKLEAVGKFNKNFMDVVHVWNQSFELISGYAVYKALREQNVDVKSAATASLNTFNFSKRGRLMSPLRAMYMFAQPAMTSGHQMAKTLRTARGRARYTAYLVAGIMLYALLRSGDDDDELGVNKMDELGNFNLYRNIPIPLGDGKYFKLPVGFGLPQLAWGHAVNIVKWAMGAQTASETIAELGYSGLKISSPVAPSDTSIAEHPATWLMQSLTPQALKGVGNIAMDVNSFGNALTNARFQRLDRAKALQGKKSTPEEYKMFSQEMARLGFDTYPEQVREFARSYLPLPALTNYLLKEYIDNPGKESRGQATVSPILDRWIALQDDDALKEKLFYRYLDKVNALAAKDSVGANLTPQQKRMSELAREITHRLAQSNGKLAAASKAEKAGQTYKAAMFKGQADKMRDENMIYLLKEYKRVYN